MAIVETSSSYGKGVALGRVVGRHLDDAATPAAFVKDVGFVPRKVRFINLTDRIEFEWFEGMTNTHALKTVAAGTRTLETSGGISVSGTTVTVAAAAVIQNKQYQYVIEE